MNPETKPQDAAAPATPQKPETKPKAGSQDISLKAITSFLPSAGRSIAPYASILIFIAIAAIYAFIILRINTYSDPEVTNEQVTQEFEAAATPHVDQNVAQKLRSLEDNSVNVQTLFEDSRENPFN